VTAPRHAMKLRGILLYWIVLVAATLACAVLLARLLGHERERLRQAVRAAAEDQVRVTAEQIRGTVLEVEADLVERLRAIPAGEAQRTLPAWARANPLVRNVFVWDEHQGVLLPNPAQALTREDALFVRRYEALFSGRTAWDGPVVEGAKAQKAPVAMQQELHQLAQSLAAPAPAGSTARADAAGWITWYWESRLNLLGWVQPRVPGPRYGVELEMAALLSRLIAAIPARVPPGLTLALVDDGGHLVYQRGAQEARPGTPALMAVELSPALPHWQVAAYADPGFGVSSGRLYLPFAVTLAGVLLTAILSGGSLLWWQAQRNEREARQKTTFVANVSHELKTPLTTIRMYAEMLREGRVPDAAKQRHYLDVIGHETQRLARLVNNVLDFSRIEQGRKQYRAQEFDAAETVRAVAETLATRLREAGLTLDLALPPGPCPVRMDRDALEQVLLNLLDNAIKYAAAGGRVQLRLTDEAGRITIRMDDAGPGIPTGHRQRLFQQFHRVDDTLTARQPGCGLGLAISRRLLRDQGGDLTYEPSPLGGAGFLIVLTEAKGERI